MTEHLPAELWSQIFSMACTDGGSTACTLSEVSRYVRTIILPLQLHNVAIIGPAKMVQFTALLQSRKYEPNYRRVRHLFLSYLWRGGGWKDSKITKDQYDIALRDLLIMTSENLITLTSTLPQHKVGPESVLYYSFPNLRELTIHGHLYEPIPFDRCVPLQANFPTLRYLHILSSPENSHVYTSRASSLTHIRLSSVWRIGDDLYAAIDNALQASTDDGTPQPPSPPFLLPHTVKRILIETRSVPLSYRPEGDDARRGPRMAALQGHNTEGKLVLLEPAIWLRQGRSNSLGLERCDWEDRIVGGHGCWFEYL